MKDKQIEEMGTIIAIKAFERAHEIDGDENLADIVATELYDKGYRKASEVAREIWAENHNIILKVINAVDEGYREAILTDNEQAKLVYAGTKETLRCVMLFLDESQKKYTEGKAEIPPYVRMDAKALPAILNVKYTEEGK